MAQKTARRGARRQPSTERRRPGGEPERHRPSAVLVEIETWGPVAGRVLLGLVFAWFGYHELVQPRLWTGYVPVISQGSTLAMWLVLAHGWLLLVLAAALVVGVLPRLASIVGALLMLEVVVALTVAHGLSDLSMRDVGVLGLALTLAGQRQRRLVLTN